MPRRETDPTPALSASGEGVGAPARGSSGLPPRAGGPRGVALAPSQTWLLYVSLVVASVLWGSLYPAAKPLVAATGPLQVTLVRAAFACATLGLLVFLRGGVEPFVTQVRTRWRGILALALLSFSVSTILAMIASNLLPASVNGLLNNTHPLWIAAGTAVLYPPRRPALLIGGSVLALLGVALVFFPDLSLASLGGPAGLNLAGVAVSLAGSGVIALSNVVGRRTMPGGDPLAILALASAAAIPPLIVLTMLNGGFAPIVGASLDVKLLLVYVGIGCTAINFSLWYSALKHLRAAQATPFQYLIPPIGVVISAVILHEPITAGLAVGAVLILGGLVTSQLGAAPAAPAPSGSGG